MKHILALVLLASLAACGGGGGDGGEAPVAERELNHFEKCKVRLIDNKCPVDQIVHEVPNIGEIIK
jgi:hypothetical protein